MIGDCKVTKSPIFNILLCSGSTDEQNGEEIRVGVRGLYSPLALFSLWLDVSSHLQQKHGSSGSYRFSLQLIPHLLLHVSFSECLYRSQCLELVLGAPAASLHGNAQQQSTEQPPFGESSKSEVPLSRSPLLPPLCYAMRSHCRTDRYHHLLLPAWAFRAVQARRYLTGY